MKDLQETRSSCDFDCEKSGRYVSSGIQGPALPTRMCNWSSLVLSRICEAQWNRSGADVERYTAVNHECETRHIQSLAAHAVVEKPLCVDGYFKYILGRF